MKRRISHLLKTTERYYKNVLIHDIILSTFPRAVNNRRFPTNISEISQETSAHTDAHTDSFLYWIASGYSLFMVEMKDQRMPSHFKKMRLSAIGVAYDMP